MDFVRIQGNCSKPEGQHERPEYQSDKDKRDSLKKKENYHPKTCKGEMRTGTSVL